MVQNNATLTTPDMRKIDSLMDEMSVNEAACLSEKNKTDGAYQKIVTANETG